MNFSCWTLASNRNSCKLGSKALLVAAFADCSFSTTFSHKWLRAGLLLFGCSLGPYLWLWNRKCTFTLRPQAPLSLVLSSTRSSWEQLLFGTQAFEFRKLGFWSAASLRSLFLSRKRWAGKWKWWSKLSQLLKGRNLRSFVQSFQSDGKLEQHRCFWARIRYLYCQTSGYSQASRSR